MSVISSLDARKCGRRVSQPGVVVHLGFLSLGRPLLPAIASRSARHPRPSLRAPMRRPRPARGPLANRSICIAVFTLLAILLSATPSAVAASRRSPNCVALNPYRATAAQRHTCGYLEQRLVSVVRRPDGGHEYRYVHDRDVSTYLEVPAGFRPALASRHLREVYGIPPEPSPAAGPQAQALWDKQIRNYHQARLRAPSTSHRRPSL